MAILKAALRQMSVALLSPARRRALGKLLTNSASPDDDARYAPWHPIAAGDFINIGAGDFSHPHWTNVDFRSPHYSGQAAPFMEYDLTARQPLPFADASVRLAYCSHTIEHVDDAAAQNLFDQLHRVLAPGGLFRLTCPDADLLHASVALGRKDYWLWCAPWFAEHGLRYEDVTLESFLVREVATERLGLDGGRPELTLTPQQVGAQFAALGRQEFFTWLTAPCVFDPAHPGRHINWWNFDKCRAALQRAGFRTVYRSSHGASLASPMQDTHHFDNTFPVMSLYLEAHKD